MTFIRVTFTCRFHLGDMKVGYVILKIWVWIFAFEYINLETGVVFTQWNLFWQPSWCVKEKQCRLRVSVWGRSIVTEHSMEDRRRQKKAVKRRSKREKERRRRSRTGREWPFHCTSTPQQVTDQDPRAEHTHLEVSLNSSPETGGVCRKLLGSPGEVSVT